MRLILVAEQLRQPVPGGIGTYVRGLVQGLDALADDARPEVTLWASRSPRGTDPLAALGSLATSPLPSKALGWAWGRGWGRWPTDADILHATSLAVPPADAGRRRPITVMVHDLAWRKVPDAFPRHGRAWHDAALGRALARATRFVVPSTGTADDLVAAGATASLVDVIEEGCDHLPPPDGDAAGAHLRRLGVHGPYLLTVSTLEPRKNLRRLLAAYEKARPRLPDPWPLVVVGPTGWGDDVPEAGGAVLAGEVDTATLHGLYAGARAVAYVPLLEGFGLPAAEAMRAGVPVVASPVPSADGAALEVDPLDTGSIADGLVQAATDDGVRASLVSAGRARAAELTWERCARRHIEVWRQLVPG